MAAWLTAILDRLTRSAAYVYRSGQASASEPAALAALALLAHDRHQAAATPLTWLLRAQQPTGAVGIRAQPTDPQWPTALAILAWKVAAEHSQAAARQWSIAIQRAVPQLLQLRGEPGKHTRDVIGHDPTLVAWAWVSSTHSWIEPTALAVMALKATQHWNHQRVREAVKLLLDRQLAGGGCNYGNTSVLGQQLRAHAQPTGMALVALANEPADERTAQSLQYLEEHWQQNTAASLAWCLLGLAAHRRWPVGAEQQLELVATSSQSAGYATYHWSLLALAAAGMNNPLLKLCTVPKTNFQ